MFENDEKNTNNQEQELPLNNTSDGSQEQATENADNKEDVSFEFKDLKKEPEKHSFFTERSEKKKKEQERSFSIGKILKEARLANDVDFGKIYEATKIRKKYLECLESDNFESLPNLLVARGYIKIYADFLGIDKDPLIDEFNRLYPGEAVGSNGPRNPNEIKLGPTTPKNFYIPRALRNMNASGFNYTSEVRGRQNKKTVTIASTAIGLVVFAIMLSNFYFRNTVGEIKTNPRQKEDVAQLESVLAPEVLQQKINSNLVFISATAIGRNYVTVVMDGRLVFKGYMERGENRYWEATQYIRIKSTLPRNLELSVNGGAVQKMADKFEAVENTYYPEDGRSAPESIQSAAPVEKKEEPVAPVVEEKKEKKQLSYYDENALTENVKEITATAKKEAEKVVQKVSQNITDQAEKAKPSKKELEEAKKAEENKKKEQSEEDALFTF